MEEYDSLRLYVDYANRVWVADRTDAPKRTRHFSQDYVRNVGIEDGRVVRILGTYRNVSLIRRVYESFRGRLGRVELATPRVCATLSELTTPEIAMLRMRQCALVSSLGGWHAMSDADFWSYLIADLVAEGISSAVASRVMKLVRRHPVWPYASFVRGMTVSNLAHVIGTVLDPRWFIDPEVPSRVSYLESYLGLSPKVQARVDDQRHIVIDKAEQRCWWVSQCWYRDPPPGDAEMEIPGNWLWLTWRHFGRGTIGKLRASQRLLSFLRHAWLAGLTGQRDLFDPGQIMSYSTLQAFREHMARQPQLQ